MKRVILSCLSAVTFFACPGPTPDTDAGVDAGHDAGVIVVDAGTDAGVDAGPACAAGDNILGALTLGQNAIVLQSSTMPTGVTQAAVINGAVYGLKGENIIPMGTFLGLRDLAPLASVNTGTAGTGFPSAFLAVNGTQLLAGHTLSSAGFPGTMTLVDTNGNGVTRIAANGNFDAVGVGNDGGFIVSALSVETQSDAGVYVVNQGITQPLVGFPSGSSSGNVALTTSGVLVYGYSDSTFTPHVLASPAGISAPFLAASGVEVYAGPESVSDVATANEDVFVLQNAFDSNGQAAPPKIMRYRLTNTGGVITVGAPVPLLTSTTACTEILFVSGNGSTVLVGLKDAANASRLLEIQP